jgi:hypothetical protein
MRSLAKAVAASSVVAFLVVAMAAHSSAETGVVYDGDDPGPGYTALEALTLFVGIPAAAIVIISIAVYAPSWMSRGSSDASARKEPLWLASPAGSMSAPVGPAAIEPVGPTDHVERGGVSGRW